MMFLQINSDKLHATKIVASLDGYSGGYQHERVMMNPRGHPRSNAGIRFGCIAMRQRSRPVLTCHTSPRRMTPRYVADTAQLVLVWLRRCCCGSPTVGFACAPPPPHGFPNRPVLSECWLSKADSVRCVDFSMGAEHEICVWRPATWTV
ncbi:hypothetical protein CKAH01_00270 [Colletotrichum kahawae]|uniref:Uncharacterized protein n=1 Tax=Colletotrichum kahawae TaxID=34407 RepID=A0AAE0DER0_COLKA|nr:hypothetical protein CKAH01_00270 [Colletotrichum kahawae]